MTGCNQASMSSGRGCTIVHVLFNKSAEACSFRIFPPVHGEDMEEPDFQDGQPPVSRAGLSLRLLAVHEAWPDSADQKNVQ